MKPLNPDFPHPETQFDQWHAENLPIGVDLLCFKTSRAFLDFSLPAFEKTGLVLTFFDYSGDIRITREGRPDQEILVRPGTGILTASGDPFRIRSFGAATVSVVMISVPRERVSRLMKDNPNFTKITGAIEDQDKMVTATLSKKQISLLSSLIDTKSNQNNPQNAVLFLIEYFLCHCHKYFFKDDLSPVLDNDADRNLVREVESYIQEGYCSDTFTVDTVLKKTYTSYHKLNFLFKSIHGVTISEYIRNKRIERSKEMITDNVKSISQIAYEIGYSSISNYILAFKKVYRITPGKYKKQIEKVA